MVSTLLWAAALAAPFMADALVLFGVLVMTLAQYGVVRMPDAYTRQHAASKMVFLGVITLLLASALPWEGHCPAGYLDCRLSPPDYTPVSSHMSGRLSQGREDARFRVRGYIEP